MTVDTGTRVQRPSCLTNSPIRGLTLADITRLHEPPTVEFEHVRVLPRVVQQTEPGRHRAPETPLPGERPTGCIPRVPPTVEAAPPSVEPLTVESWLPGEGPTRMLDAVPSFPKVLPAPSPRPLLERIMRAAHRLRGILGGGR